MNVCAANFSTSRPSQSIAAALAASRKPKKREEIDLTLLPSDDLDSTEAGVLVSDSGTDPILIEDDEIGRDEAVKIDLEAEEEDLVYVGEDRPAFTTCKVCGSRLFAFSAAAHKAFHDKAASAVGGKTDSKDAKKRKAMSSTATATATSGAKTALPKAKSTPSKKLRGS